MRLGRGALLLVPILLIAAALVTLGSRFDMRPGAGAALGAESAITLQGTGATFPAPLYQRWFTEYNKAHPEVQINYQALGSGAGIKQFQQGLVDFGASDAAMTDEEMAEVKDGVVLLPMTAGSIVLAYNLPDGPSELKLSREAYVGNFPRQDHAVERPGDRQGESGRETARHQDHRRGPLRRQRHDFRLHPAPERDQRRVEERPGRRQVGQFSGWRRRARATPASPR